MPAKLGNRDVDLDQVGIATVPFRVDFRGRLIADCGHYGV